MNIDYMMDRWVDLALLALLAGVLVYGMLLSHRLKRFRAARTELEALVATLSGTVAQAKAAVIDLTATGEEADERLAARMKQMRRLTDELDEARAEAAATAERLTRAARPAKTAAAPARAQAMAAAPIRSRSTETERPIAASAATNSLSDAIAAIEARQRAGAAARRAA
ncbi:MAG: DUF6468 domain-containing protein [Pseudomonadota bacterium]